VHILKDKRKQAETSELALKAKLFMSPEMCAEAFFILVFSSLQPLSEQDSPRRPCVLQMFQTAETMSLIKQLHTVFSRAFWKLHPLLSSL